MSDELDLQHYLDSGGAETSPTPKFDLQSFLDSGGEHGKDVIKPTEEQGGYFSKYFGGIKTAFKGLGKQIADKPLTSIATAIPGALETVTSPVASTLAGASAVLHRGLDNTIGRIPGTDAIGFDPNATFSQRKQEYEAGLHAAPETAMGQQLSGAAGAVLKPVGDVISLPGKAVSGIAKTLGVSPENAQSVEDQTNAVVNAALLSAGTRKSQEKPEPALTEKEIALKKAHDLGLVVPPATSNPTALTHTLEGFSGKLSTAQYASVKNQVKINQLARDELSLPEGARLTPETMSNVRKSAAPAYEALKAVPEIEFGESYNKALSSLTKTADKISATLPNYKGTASTEVKSLVDALKPSNGVMDGETAVELSKSLRSEAAAHDMTASRTGDPFSRSMARAYRGASEAVENAIEDHLVKSGQPELAANWDNARRTIAKTYSIEKALDGAGNVDAGKLGKQLIKGKPLSGNLSAIADFANHFPKAAKATNESMPGMSPLDVYGSAGAAVISGNPLPLLLGPGRMAARSALLGPVGQFLGTPGQSALTSALQKSAEVYKKPIALSALLATKEDQRK